jgi:hypothetical protein
VLGFNGLALGERRRWREEEPEERQDERERAQPGGLERSRQFGQVLINSSDSTVTVT